MENVFKDNGKMESIMELEFLEIKKEKKPKDNGIMEKEFNGFSEK